MSPPMRELLLPWLILVLLLLILPCYWPSGVRTRSPLTGPAPCTSRGQLARSSWLAISSWDCKTAQLAAGEELGHGQEVCLLWRTWQPHGSTK